MAVPKQPAVRDVRTAVPVIGVLPKVADVIFIFDADLFRAVNRCARRQQMAPKVFYVGSVDTGHPLEIKDPYGKSLQEFEATYGRIARLIDRAAAAIDGTITRTETAA
jgi:protein-tyrosine-phosphatase